MTYALTSELTWVTQQALLDTMVAAGAAGAQVGAQELGLERYELIWSQKAQVRSEALRTPALTLAPVNGADPNFASSGNLTLAGDPINALKVLQRSLVGAVKLVWGALAPLDLAQSLAVLTLVRSLMRRDGCCLLLCPDASGLASQRALCDEVLGANNFVATLVWQPHEHAALHYVLLYAKSVAHCTVGRLPRTAAADRRYSNPDNDPRGVWQSDNLSVKTYSKSCDYPITTPSGRVVYPAKGRAWSLSKESFEKAVADNRIWFGASGSNVPRIKRFLCELKHEGLVPTSLLLPEDLGTSSSDEPVTAALAQRLVTLAHVSSGDLSLLVGTSAMCQPLAHALYERGDLRLIALTTDHEAHLSWPPRRELKLVARHDPARPLNTYSQECLIQWLESESTPQEPWARTLEQLFAYLCRTGLDFCARIERKELVGLDRSYLLADYGAGQVWFCAEPEIDLDLITAVAACAQRPQRLVCCEASFSSDCAKINCSEQARLLLGPQVLTMV